MELRSELRQAITSCAEHDDGSVILLRVADTASKALEDISVFLEYRRDHNAPPDNQP